MNELKPRFNDPWGTSVWGCIYGDPKICPMIQEGKREACIVIIESHQVIDDAWIENNKGKGSCEQLVHMIL